MAKSARVIGGANVEHTGEAPAKSRGEHARHELDASDGGVEKGSEQPAQMEWVVDGIAVEQHEVLIRLAAMHDEPRVEIVARDHAGHQLHRASDVRLADGGDRVHRLHAERRDAHVRPLAVLPFLGPCPRLHRREQLRAAMHGEVGARRVAAFHDHVEIDGAIAQQLHAQRGLPCRHAADAIAAVGRARRAERTADHRDPRAGEGSAGTRVAGDADAPHDDTPRRLLRGE